MNSKLLAAYTSTSCFVLLWGAAAIFTRWGLDYASPMLLLVLRFLVALVLLLMIGLYRQKLLPKKGTTRQVMWVGLFMIGGYSVCYFQAMTHGLTPGLIATIMGVQPILTLCVLDRDMNFHKLLGLSIALVGLVTLVWDSVMRAHITVLGMGFALAALLCISFGAILQKNIQQHPAEILPLQYVIGLLLCLLLLPFEQITLTLNGYLLSSVLFLGILISVVAQILLYKLLNSENIVNVTSLFYLVPVVTAILDYLLLGNTLAWSGIVGMLAIFIGVILVFHLGKHSR